MADIPINFPEQNVKGCAKKFSKTKTQRLALNGFSHK